MDSNRAQGPAVPAGEQGEGEDMANPDAVFDAALARADADDLARNG